MLDCIFCDCGCETFLYFGYKVRCTNCKTEIKHFIDYSKKDEGLITSYLKRRKYNVETGIYGEWD